MAAVIRGTEDQELSHLKQRLAAYELEHPGAKAELYRQNPASIRIRVTDNRFAGMPRSSRHREVWKYLQELSEDIQQQITVLLLLPEAELKSSLMNLEFEDPVPSTL